MIQEVKLSNFQSHKDSVLVLDPGVNVIVGTSDSGKTAVIRALRLAIANRPSGDAFVSKWIKKGEQSLVEINVDGDVVTRQEYPEKVYMVNDMEFKAFKLSVPDEVQSTLNMNEINIQGQLDAPFLLSNSPGEVALHFNKVARLDKIDTGLANVQHQIKSLTTDIAYLKERKEKLTTDLEQFEHLQKFEIDLEVLEDMQAQRKRKASKISDLDVLLSRLTEVQESLDEKSSVIKMEVVLTKVLEQVEQKRTLALSIRRLESLIADINSDQRKLTSYASTLEIEESVNNVLKLIANKDVMKRYADGLKKALNGIGSTTNMLEQKEAEFERLHAQFDKEMPDVCPLCNQKIK